MPALVHLHCHSQYSLLDGACDIAGMMDKVKKDGQLGVALTDHGNMFGAFNFVNEANKRGLKAIVGCEFYMVADRHKQSFSKVKGEKDERFHQLLLAKNQSGYQNLSKLCSLGYIEGSYGKYPRIDKELVLKYHEGLIATSCCVGAEIPQAILQGKLEEAERLVKWWKDLFGGDFYIELQDHGIENLDHSGLSQSDLNKILIGFAKKFDIKTIATNDVHYLEEDDWEPHDILLCVNTNSKLLETNRFRFPKKNFYLKTQEEMNALFAHVPQSLENTMEVLSKIETPKLKRDIILPNFPIPGEYKTQDEYLRAIVYDGARRCYGELNAIVTERIEFELKVITEMKFSGYFLIVQDFIKAARKIGVRVGPGRGSAAGSVVAYCLNITGLDPIKYNLLFERFLNPQRISMPDMDIDFDDEGRQKVIDYVVEKYGKEQVAQIVTFSTMAAKSSIRDVGRVLDYPLSETDQIAKMVPLRPKVHLVDLLNKEETVLKAEYTSDEMVSINKLREIKRGKDQAGTVLSLAERLEGSVRNTGIHAAGIIIAPDAIDKIIPVFTSKETELLVTQFEGSLVEEAGMLKMDFLGLRTLSILNDALKLIEETTGEQIDLDTIPLDDALTFELFQKGEMVGIFQFESDGMQKYLRDLRPENVEDLIAMNALYRPGPMDNIPTFIKRKMGQEKVEYPHEKLSELLKPTYGILVYQEQIMQTAQIMAGYTLASADMLRRAMGKKKHEEMQKHRALFVEGSMKNGVDENKAEEVFELMARFADYGFNRSHAAAYSILAFQTAYLKARYPSQFMAAVLTHNKNDITKLEFYLQETRRMGLEVLGPDINESGLNFSVKDGRIRFGLSALKGVGEGPVDDILNERKANGPYTSIFNITSRLNLRTVNKKSIEALVLGGALDSLSPEVDRAAYFVPTERYESYIEHALRTGSAWQEMKNRNTMSLFSVEEETATIPEIPFPKHQPWSLVERLNREKEVTGIYISAHPLDEFRYIIENFTTCSLSNVNLIKDQPLKLAGIVAKAEHKISKKGTGYGSFVLEDYTGSFEFPLFSEDFMDFKNRLEVGQMVLVKATNMSLRDGTTRFKISGVQQLATAGSNITESITIKMPLHQINVDKVNYLQSMIANHKGNVSLKVVLLDAITANYLYLKSDEHKIEVNNKLLHELTTLGFDYKLN